MLNNNKQIVSIEHVEYVKNIKKNRFKVILTQISILFVFIAFWEIAARFGWIDTFTTSSPSQIFTLFIRYIKTGSLFTHIGVSLMENIIAFTGGTILGIIVAIILWWSAFISKVLEPYLVVLNSLPKIALAPIILLWFGAGYSGIIATAISIALIITILNMSIAFKEVDHDKTRLLKTFGATRFQILKLVIIPSTVPAMISSLKINIGLSWVGVIVGEFLVSKAGLGHLIFYGGQVFKLDLVMMSVIILAILAAVMYQLVTILEKKFLKWKE